MAPICNLMTRSDQSGFYLFHKSRSSDSTLKVMLQFLKSHGPNRSLQFAYVESETSLIPHLSLWENLQIMNGAANWNEFVANFESEWQPLLNLIQNPDLMASAAGPWERLTISLIKATLIKSNHILIDIDESMHSHLNLANFKKMLNTISEYKNIYIATSDTSQWVDSAHSLITRDGYKFVVESVTIDGSKRLRTA
jgi:hypothetical protein